MNATPQQAQHWQRTLWTMVGVQFVMSISFSILSPIMPLFLPELGVLSTEAVDIWAGVLPRSLRLSRSSQRRFGAVWPIAMAGS